jgi:hypothetical protein
MRYSWWIIVAVALFFGLLAVTSCQSGGDGARIPIPTQDLLPAVGEEAPDDIVPTPGGIAYRANVNHQGEENPWPPVETVVVEIDDAWLRYRDHIETKAGETRNNIFSVGQEDGFWEVSLSLYATSIPSGITLAQSIGGASPGTLDTVLMIEVSPNAAPGQYTLEIGLEIDGSDYGTVPCIIEVVGK